MLKKIILIFLAIIICAVIGGATWYFPLLNQNNHQFGQQEYKNQSVAVVDEQEIQSKQKYEETLHQEQLDEILVSVNNLINGYFYDEALDLLNQAGNDERVEELRQRINKLKSELVKYDGRYYHIFFHSLIIDTKKAFDGDYKERGYNMYMTTTSEFKKMLPLLLANDFVLYDITQMIEIKDGKAYPKDIYLPVGKKPLILSIDDVNYYEYMKNDGFADRLDVDANGNVVTVVKNDDGTESITYDGDVMPILDNFVKEHPEFSYRGAKGIVAITGYQGAFGYRITNLKKYEKKQQDEMLNKVKQIAYALRNNGWQIANHSFTHNQYWAKKTMTMKQLKYDIQKWLSEIAPYVGTTPIIITPFGAMYEQKDPRFRYIVDSGFYIYCPVGSQMDMTWQNDNLVSSRLNLDGLTMLHYPQRINKYFFNPNDVLDSSRPQLQLEVAVKKRNKVKNKSSINNEIENELIPINISDDLF